MLTATTTLITTIAVVSLGAGTLLFSAVSDPTPVPATTPSPSPTSWTPPPGLDTEELAPGVLFASHAGVGSSRHGDLAFDADGGIWLLTTGRLKRVGDVGSLPGPSVGLDFADLTGSPDGALWSLAKGTVASFRDDVWTTVPAFPGDAPAKALEVLPDGTVWARSTTTLARLDGDTWTAYPIVDDQGQIADYVYLFPGGFASTPDGSLWVSICDHTGNRAGQLLRFDGSKFQPVTPPPPQVNCYSPLASGPEGELWAFISTDPPALARFDGMAWKVSDADADIPHIAASGGYTGNMIVAPDGRLWAAGASDRGLVLGVYDGTTWTDVFTDTEDLDLLERPLQVAPDGTIWLWVRNGFLVIDPAAAGATAE